MNPGSPAQRALDCLRDRTSKGLWTTYKELASFVYRERDPASCRAARQVVRRLAVTHIIVVWAGRPSTPHMLKLGKER